MTKLITVTSIRAGTGKTTVASILAEKLSERYSVCVVDNNRSNVNIFSSNASSIENIKLYMCLDNNESCKRAIKESAEELKKNLFFFSGSQELLTEKEIKFLKEINMFDYIIVDAFEQYNYEICDLVITVTNPNIQEYFEAQKYNKTNNITVINRYTNEIEFKISKDDFKLYFCAEIINFTNGYELKLPEENKKEVESLIEKIAEEQYNEKKPKFSLFKRR